jgi:hypothetical protein
MQRPQSSNIKADYYSYKNRAFRAQKYFVLLKQLPLRRKSIFLRKRKKRQRVHQWELRRLKKPLLKRKRWFRKNITFLRNLKNKVQRSNFRPQPNLSTYYNTGLVEVSSQ